MNKKTKRSNVIPVRMSDELRAKIIKAAKVMEQSMSDWIRIAIFEKLDRDKK